MRRFRPMVSAVLAVLGVGLLACEPPPPPRVLVFSRTAGYRHSSIEVGKKALIALGTANGMIVDTTEDASRITEDSLKQYAAVVFLQTTGNLLDRAAEVDLQRYIQAGGGFVGIHAAADAEYDWRWYGRLVGGYFESHPAIQKATLRVVERDDPATKHLGADWVRTDEWYNFKQRTTGLHVLLSIDESSYTGGTNGFDHAMSWYHEVDGGRAWYTALGHTEESYADSSFLKHVLGGLRYAIGKQRALDYQQATAMRVPPDSILTKTVLTQGTLTEPTEMAVLPGGDVLIAQRGGIVQLYRDADKSLRPALTLKVYDKSHTPAANAEEGLLGLTVDPDFARNKYVYLFYSPVDTSVNRLSRFVFDGDSIKLGSEKIVLQFYSQREICCHTGGSLAFGPSGELYLSTGDNSTPFDEAKEPHATHGFNPTDDRPGHMQFDSRRTAGNTNDLRGKILRIRVKADGSYEIPAGNLFAPGTPDTRPEIYVMGNRNPYRISVDQESGFLYWGEVGPDSNADSLETRGPRGYDEINQARKAGNYGWPMFVGNNYAYHQWDYATGTSGPLFDAKAPINNSRNSTGVKALPPAQPPLIWYPYGESTDFATLGTGGRTALAGPIYHPRRFTDRSPSALPDYYDGKFFIYDWMRDWVMAVTLRPNGDYEAMERVLPNAKFASPIDMELGPDGRMYILEYGKGWFVKASDAALSRIGYKPTSAAK